MLSYQLSTSFLRTTQNLVLSFVRDAFLCSGPVLTTMFWSDGQLLLAPIAKQLTSRSGIWAKKQMCFLVRYMYPFSTSRNQLRPDAKSSCTY